MIPWYNNSDVGYPDDDFVKVKSSVNNEEVEQVEEKKEESNEK